MCLCHQAVIETLSVGATMLLPPLRERMELLHSLLPQGPDRWESLSKGQVPYAIYTQKQCHWMHNYHHVFPFQDVSGVLFCYHVWMLPN